MIMNVVFVDMGADDESMASFGKAFGKFTTNAVRFLRRNFAGNKGLTEMIGDHVVRAARPAGECSILTFGKKELGVGCTGVTFIAGDEPAIISFLRILRIVDDVADCCAYVPSLSGMQRHQPRSRHELDLPSHKKRSAHSRPFLAIFQLPFVFFSYTKWYCEVII